MQMSDKKYLYLEHEIDRLIFSTEKTIQKQYLEASDSLKKQIADVYEKHGGVSNATMNKYKRLETLHDRLAETVQIVYRANREEINSVLRQSYLQTSKGIVDIANDEVGRTLKPITKSKHVTEVINSKVQNLSWRERMGKHQGDTIYDLKKEIGIGIERGESYSEVAKRIQTTFDVDEARAKTIARNETARVKSVSEKETMDSIRREGVKMTKTWNNVLDERSRSDHADMDGVTIPYDEEFKLPGGASAELPRLSGEGAHDINCRCYVTYSFEE